MLIDFDNKIKIPYNKNIDSKLYFIIEKAKKWNYSIDIKILKNEEIDIFNLYSILKRYLENKEFPVYQIMIVMEVKEREIIFYNYKSINFKWKKFSEFQDWYYNQLNESWKYQSNTEENMIIIRLLFNKRVIDSYNKSFNKGNVLNFIKPVYDWENIHEIDEINEIVFIYKTTKNQKLKELLEEVIKKI